MTFSLQKLNPRHYKILDMCLQGLQAVDIASQLKMSPTQINNIIRSPSFQHQFALRRQKLESIQDTTEVDSVKQLLKQNAEKAASKLVDCINSDDERIAIKSASEILDRSGYPKEQQQNVQDNSVNIIISADELSILKESLSMISVNEKQDIQTVNI